MDPNVVRTPEELQKLEFNYFEAYKIPLTETDVAKIQSKINMLARTKANTSNPIDIRIGKDLKTDALNVMSDPALRAKEAANYKKLIYDKIRQEVMMFCTSGQIFKSELVQIADKHKINVTELEQEIKPLLGKVKYIDDTQKLFDFGTYENAEKYLKGYLNGQFADMFQLLGLPVDCTAAAAKATLAQKKQDDSAIMMKKSGEGIALKNLYGEAEKVFSSDPAKLKAYAKYVKIREHVYVPLKARKDNGLTTIEEGEYLNLLQMTAKSLGESLDDAKLDLTAILTFCKIKPRLSSTVSIEACPYPDCGKLYPAGTDVKSCPHCGRSFEVACWNCKGSMHMSKSTQACPHCGVSEKAQKLFNTQLSALDLLMRNPKCTLGEMKNGLNALIAVVPSYGRVASSETAKKIGFYTAEISKKETAEQGNLKIFMDGVAEIDKHIALKQFRKADMLLSDLKKKVPGFNTAVVDKYAKDIAAAIATSDTLTANAKKYVAAGNESLAIDSAMKALEACVDNTEAQQIMRKVPPAQPTSVTCRIKNDKSAYLEWNVPAGQKFVGYSVIRKVGAKPTSVTDGTVIAKDISLNFFEDTAITAATPYYYGVFGERYGVQSALGVTPSSVSVFPDITDCNQEMVEGKIKLKWSCPASATVKVRKAKGTTAPTADTGTELKTDANNGLTDGDCDTKGCSYFVYCEYDVAGVKKQSKGVQLYYKPYYIPKEATKLEFSRTDNGEYFLKGEQIDGDTKLYLFTKKPAFGSGKVEPMHRFASAGGTSVGMSASGNGYSFTVPSGKTGWLYVVNMNDQLFVASQPYFVTGEKGISNVKYMEKEGTVTINCDISPSVYQIVAKVSTVGFVNSTKDAGTSYTFTPEQIQRNGGMVLKVLADSMSYITLFALVGTNKENAECSAVPLDDVIDYRKKQVVKYSMEYEANPAKSFTITLKFEAETEVSLPKFMIVKGAPRPMNKSAGELVAHVDGVQLKKGLFSHGKFCGKAVVKAAPMAKFFKLSMFIAEDGVKNIQMKEVTSL